MTRRGLAFVLVLLGAGAGPALSVQPDEIMADRAQEGRARAISAELRCLVCQNQSIDDSDAPLARDLRLLVRERIAAGDSDAGVRNYVVGRYGDFVLLRPPVAPHTFLLWLAPAVLVVAAGCGLAAARRRRPSDRETRLTGDEEARLRAILGKDGG